MTRTFAASASLAVFLAVTPIAKADSCEVVAAAGNGPTEAIAKVMSTHGLENIIEAKGLKAEGPIKTKCEPGTFLVECRSQQKACK